MKLEVLKRNKKLYKDHISEFREDNVYKNYNADKIHRILVKNNFSLKKIFQFSIYLGR